MNVRVPRSAIGKCVEVTWRDPNFGRGDIDKLVKGRAALATWKEYGIVHDITDGVVLIAHSYGQNVGQTEPDELARTAVDEAMIEGVTVLVPEPTP